MQIFANYCKKSQKIAKNLNLLQNIAINCDFLRKSSKVNKSTCHFIANHFNFIQFYWNKFNNSALSQMKFWQIACLVRRHWKYFQIWRLFEICLFQIVSIYFNLFQFIAKFLKKSQIIANNCNISRKITIILNFLQKFAISCDFLWLFAIICKKSQF